MNIFKRRLKKDYELAMEGWHSQIAENEKLKSTINHLNEQIAELKDQLAKLGNAYSDQAREFNLKLEEIRKNSEDSKETTRKFIEKKSGRRSRRTK